MAAPLVTSWEQQIRKHFAECRTTQFEPLIQSITNDPKDRHVVAAAVKAGAQIIVTFNLRHYRRIDLDPWDIEAQHPDTFLCHLHSLSPEIVREKISVQAAEGRKSLPQLLNILERTAPQFADRIRNS